MTCFIVVLCCCARINCDEYGLPHCMCLFLPPGIGVPATAASGAIAANTIVSVFEHLGMLDKVKLPLKQ